MQSSVYVEFSSLVNEDDVYIYIQNLLSLSKNFVKKNLIDKKIRPAKSLKIKKGDLVTIPINVSNRGMINPVYYGKNIEIVHECSEFVAFSKPYNVHSHPLSYDEQDNVLSHVRDKLVFQNSKYNNMLNVNSKNYDRGLLYRLDYATSGVLFYAKNDMVHKKIRDGFESLCKEKIYLAIVSGNFNNIGDVIHKIKYQGVNNSEAVALPIDDGNSFTDSVIAKMSILSANFNSSYNVSLLKIQLHSGLRNQIRAQLAALGFPILGDAKFGDVVRTDNSLVASSQQKRTFLHAYKYQFVLDGKTYSVVDNNAELFSHFFDLFE